MIVWQGYGMLAALIPIVFFFITTAIADAVGGPHFGDTHHWVWGISLLLSAAAVWVVAQKFKDAGRNLIDPQTGQTVTLRRKHTLFFIPMEYWAYIFGAAGLFRLFV